MRIARVTVPGAFHHVISRFVDRDWRFREERERERYLDYLGRALTESDWLCISYALMSNHIHLGLIAGKSPIGHLLKRVNAPFARWMNVRHERIGPLFAERPATWLIRSEYVAATVAYIHNNPVRARVVAHAGESTWTSYRAYTGAAAAPAWLGVDDGLRLVDLATADFEPAMEQYRHSREDLAVIQGAAHRRGAVEIGTPTLAPIDVPLVCRPYARIRPDPREVIAAVGEVLEILPTRFASRSTSGDCVHARRIAVHAALALGLSAADIGSALGITRSGASKLGYRKLSRAEQALVVVICDALTPSTPSPAKAAQGHG
jgi:REP element-mobilizing transposase RayT